MREFFLSWRREFGVVTLAIAGFLAMLIGITLLSNGSGRVTVTIQNKGEKPMESVVLHEKEFSQMSLGGEEVSHPLGDLKPDTSISVTVKPVRESNLLIEFGPSGGRQRTRGSGLVAPWYAGTIEISVKDIEVESVTSQLSNYWVVYWSIVGPLSLISIWLLVSKLRRSTSKKFTEPVPEKLT
jgi:hypothetical protein